MPKKIQCVRVRNLAQTWVLPQNNVGMQLKPLVRSSDIALLFLKFFLSTAQLCDCP